MHIKNVNKQMNSFHLPLINPQMRMTQFEKWGDGSSLHKLTLNKQSQEGYNLFLRLHCVLIWISLEDMISGLERDRGISLIADVMPSHQLRDQTSDEEWPVLVPSFQAILNTAISLCSLPLWPIVAYRKKEVKFPHGTAWRGSFSSRFLFRVLFGICPLQKEIPLASGSYFCEVLNQCQVSLRIWSVITQDTHSKTIETNGWSYFNSFLHKHCTCGKHTLQGLCRNAAQSCSIYSCNR